MIRLVLYLLLLIFAGTLNAQFIQGTTWDGENNLPLSFATITFAQSNKIAVSNRDGHFRIKINDQERKDTVVISSPGYKSLRIFVPDLVENPDIIITCHPSPINYLDNMPAKTRAYKSQKIWEEVMNNIESNNGNDDHIINGFFTKEVVLADTALLAYSEGEVAVVKKGYKKNPKSSYFQSIWEKEKVVLKNGFYQEFPVLLKDTTGKQYLFPFLNDGSHIGTMDVLKFNDGPFNSTKRTTHKINLVGETTYMGHNAYLFSFDYSAPFAFDNGKMWVHKDDYALLAVTYEYSFFQLTRYNSRQHSVELKRTQQSIEYKKSDNHYSLINAHISSDYIHKGTKDRVTAYTLFIADAQRLKKNKEELNQLDHYDSLMEDFSEKYMNENWTSQLPFARPYNINKSLKIELENKINQKDGGLFIQYRDTPLQELANNAVDEGKLILINLFDKKSDFTNTMESITLLDTQVVKIINQGFISSRIHVDQEEVREFLFPRDVPVSAQIAVLDPYNNVYFRLDQFCMPRNLSDQLYTLSQSIDLKKVSMIFESDTIDPDEKGILAGREIFLMLAESDNDQKFTFVDNYLGKEKTWTEADKLDLIFYHLIDEKPEICHQYFIKNLKYFKKKYPADEIEKKLILTGIKEFQLSGFHAETIDDFFYTHLPDKADSLIKVIQLHQILHSNYSSYDKSRSIMRYYARKGIDDWEYDRHIILDAILSIEDRHLLLAFLELLDVNWFKETPHECLDLHALIYYKIGEKKKATNMVNLIREMALKKALIIKVHFIF